MGTAAAQRVYVLATSTALAILLAATPAIAQPPLPFDMGGPFTLTDQHGETRTEDSFDAPALLFFGYADCQSICTVALPRMAETVDLLAERGIETRPVLVTIDPARDTVDSLAARAPAIHPRLIGLTGDEDALAQARAAYRVESEKIGEDIAGPIYAHGSFVYLLDEAGDVLTLMPPVLGAERMAEIAAGYLGGDTDQNPLP